MGYLRQYKGPERAELASATRQGLLDEANAATDSSRVIAG
jgi:hypothetical protein